MSENFPGTGCAEPVATEEMSNNPAEMENAEILDCVDAEHERAPCRWSLPGSKTSGDLTHEAQNDAKMDDDHGEVNDDNGDDNAFLASGNDNIDQGRNNGDDNCACNPPSAPSPTALSPCEMSSRALTAGKTDDTPPNGSPLSCNNSNNNNNSDKTNNNDTTTTSREAMSPKMRGGGSHLVGRLFSSSSSSSFFPSPMHKSSSLSSISEEEMLNMMERMGESEIMSALPPCDCDECLLNDSGGTSSIVAPDKRKLTRTRAQNNNFLCVVVDNEDDLSDWESPIDVDLACQPTRRRRTSSWRKIRSFILWSPFIQVFKKHRYPWIQLAGHQGNFHAGEAGSVLKKLDPREQLCFQRLMADPLKDFVPEYRGDVEKNGEMYIQLQDLLASFCQPCVMDVKMGVRTYLEAELEKARRSPTLRKDMYQKMVEVDSSAPTQTEHEQRAVTKPRYMQWRDQMSSSTELGFRVEGIKKTDGSSTKDFKKTKSRQNIADIISSFVANNETIAMKYIKRLKEIMAMQESSDFFRSHEVVGSSLLFVHDAEENVGVWMIDFGKTEQLSSGKLLDHRSEWQEGNREDGYLFGLDNLVSIFDEVHTSLSSSSV